MSCTWHRQVSRLLWAATSAAHHPPAVRRELEAVPAAERGPLHGVPFAVKDNIDAAGFPTTAACEAFRYSPAHSAPAVQALVDAGDSLCVWPSAPVPSVPAASWGCPRRARLAV